MFTGHYSFNANALGLGGVVEGPCRRVIPSTAATVLAPTGGEGSSLVTNFCEHGVAFDRAEARVWGSRHNATYSTRAEVWLTNLDIFGKLQVQSMWAAVTTIRDVQDDGTVIDRKFTFQAEILGLRANGRTEDTPLDANIFEDNPSYEEFVRSLNAKDRGDYRALIGLSDDDAAKLERDVTATPPAMMTPPTIRCSLLRKPFADGGNALAVPGLGRVHVAEALVKPGRRRLTLLRIELDPQTGTLAPVPGDAQPKTFALMKGPGGGDGGAITGGSVEGNGTTGMP